MKTKLLILALLFHYTFSQNVAIAPVVMPPDPSAMLDVISTTKGLLVPRMTTLQRSAIPSPVVSLLIFNLDINCFEYYNGATWLSICGTTAGPTTTQKDSMYLVSTTWIKPAGLKGIRVKVQGGGGGGGGINATGVAGSAGGGGYAEKYIDAALLAPTENIVVGTGGAGGVLISGNPGGTSSFGAFVSATGGSPGLQNGNGGTGGIGIGGDFNNVGQPGGNGNNQVAIVSVIVSTPGGNSFLGYGGGILFGKVSNAGFFGNPGTGYGSGGSGTIKTVGGGGNGGPGAPGVMIITEYY